MEHRRFVRLGDLAVHDAVTGGRDVEFTRPYHRLRARRRDVTAALGNQLTVWSPV
jgi:hypothetical protein